MKKRLLNLLGVLLFSFFSFVSADKGIEETQTVDIESLEVIIESEQSYYPTFTDIGSCVSETMRWTLRKVVTSPVLPLIAVGISLLGLAANVAADPVWGDEYCLVNCHENFGYYEPWVCQEMCNPILG